MLWKGSSFATVKVLKFFVQMHPSRFGRVPVQDAIES